MKRLFLQREGNVPDFGHLPRIVLLRRGSCLFDSNGWTGIRTTQRESLGVTGGLRRPIQGPWGCGLPSDFLRARRFVSSVTGHRHFVAGRPTHHFSCEVCVGRLAEAYV